MSHFEERRKRSRSELQQLALAELAQASVEAEAVQDFLERSLATLQRVLGVPLAGVIEYRAAADTFTLRAGIGWNEGVVGRRTAAPPTDSPEVLALRAGRTVRVDDIDADERFGEQVIYERHGIRSSLLAVIWAGREPWGLLGTLDTAPHRFDPVDVDFVQSAAALLGHVLARARQHEEIEEHRRLLDAILRGTPDSIVTIDGAGTIRTVNPAVSRMFGHDEADLVGRNVKMLMPAEHAHHHDDYLQRYLDGGEARIIGIGRELEAQHRSGRTFPIDLAVSEIVIGGERLFVGTMRDLTQRRAMQQQLLQAQKMEAVGQLTGGVAHDFNNLLTVIQSNLTSLGESELRAADRELLAETMAAAQRGSSLTQRLLAFARQQPLAPQALDVNALVEALVPLLRRTFGERFTVEAALQDTVWTCHVDPGQLEAALLNLAVNARDAMPDGGCIRLCTSNSVLDAAPSAAEDAPVPGEYVAISVIDDGPGMAPSVLANAFEPFFTTKPFGLGSGLGLSMVFGFARQSGGHVTLQSVVGEGTEASILLPRSLDAQLESPSEPVAVAAGDAGRAPRLRILMVEDDVLVGSSTRRMLEHLGHEVTLVTDAAQALATLLEGSDFDLLFTDMVMPGSMDGMALTLAARAERPTLPVLITSGYSDGGLDDETLQDSGIRFLSKPYSRRTLGEGIVEALSMAGSIVAGDGPRGPE